MLERSMMKSSTLFEHGPLPPYVHIASTRCHSRGRCSQAFLVFRALPLPKNKKRGRPGNEATSRVLQVKSPLESIVKESSVFLTSIIFHFTEIFCACANSKYLSSKRGEGPVASKCSSRFTWWQRTMLLQRYMT